MKLSGRDIENLVDAIVSAYPTKDDLDMMITFGFGVDEQLDKITGGNDIKKIVFHLITNWAIPDGKLERLIEEAYNQKSGNPKLKDFYQNVYLKIKHSLLSAMGVLPSDDSQAITPTEWHELYFILKDINNNQLITQICRQTLKNSRNDILGSCLELSSNIDLKNLKEILLNKFPRRNDDIPTILEFAERLNNEVEGNLSTQLEQWIIDM